MSLISLSILCLTRSWIDERSLAKVVAFLMNRISAEMEAEMIGRFWQVPHVTKFSSAVQTQHQNNCYVSRQMVYE